MSHSTVFSNILSNPETKDCSRLHVSYKVHMQEWKSDQKYSAKSGFREDGEKKNYLCCQPWFRSCSLTNLHSEVWRSWQTISCLFWHLRTRAAVDPNVSFNHLCNCRWSLLTTKRLAGCLQDCLDRGMHNAWRKAGNYEGDYLVKWDRRMMRW